MTRISRKMRVISAVFGGLAVFALGLTPALAQGTNFNTFQVTAKVVDTCTVSTAPLSFGNYDPSNPLPTDATARTDVACGLSTTPWEVEYDHGLFSSVGTCFTRRLRNADFQIPLTFLTYTINDASHTGTILGLIVDKPSCTTQTGSGTAFDTVFGRIGPGQSVRATDYSDTITVTVHF